MKNHPVATDTAPRPPQYHYPWGESGYTADPYPYWADARAVGGVLHWVEGGSLLAVSAAAVHEALSDDTRFSLRDPNSGVETRPWTALMHDIGLFWAPPEHHQRLRSVLRAAFNRDSVTAATAAGIATIDRAAGTARDAAVDLHDTISAPFAVAALCAFLGVDADDNVWFQHVARPVLELTNPFADDTTRDAAEAALAQVHGWTSRLTATPRDGTDVLAGLSRARADGQLSDDEAFIIVVALLLAGVETTATSLSVATLELLDHTDTYRAATGSGALSAGAVDELLRRNYIGTSLARWARTDTTLDGYTVHAGETIIVHIGSALRDSGGDNPANLDARTRNLAFGAGAHHCAGAAVARATLGAGLAHLCELGVTAEGPPRWDTHPFLRVPHYPVRFTNGS